MDTTKVGTFEREFVEEVAEVYGKRKRKIELANVIAYIVHKQVRADTRDFENAIRLALIDEGYGLQKNSKVIDRVVKNVHKYRYEALAGKDLYQEIFKRISGNSSQDEN